MTSLTMNYCKCSNNFAADCIFLYATVILQKGTIELNASNLALRYGIPDVSSKINDYLLKIVVT